MMLIRSTTKAVLFALAVTIFLLHVSSSKAHESSEHESCLNETAIIHSDAGVASAIEEAINGTLMLEDPSTCSSGSSTLTCTYDFNTASSNVDSVCTAAGGQYVVYAITLTCDVTTGGTTNQVTYVFTNGQNCIGASCDPTDDHENEETFSSRLADTLNNFTGIDNCYAAQVTSNAPPNWGAKTFLVTAGALLLASMFLF